MNIKKGMMVKVLNGNHKDSEGKVLNVFPKKQRVIVEGVNFRKRATRPTQENPSGGFVEREASIHISNVMTVHGGQATRVGYKLLDDGSKVRISKKTNEEIEVK
jgi:large subunit ribosomal protein L24